MGITQRELFEEETTVAIQNLEHRISRLADELRLLTATVRGIRPCAHGIEQSTTAALEAAVKELQGWREVIERREDLLAAELAGRSLRLVK